MKNYGIWALLLIASLTWYGCTNTSNDLKTQKNQNETIDDSINQSYSEEKFLEVKNEYFRLLALKIKEEKSLVQNRDVQTAGKLIPLKDAREHHCNWENRVSLGYEGALDNIRAVMFNTDSLIDFARKSNSAALRMYFVLRLDSITGNYVRDVLLVPVDSSNNDMVKILTEKDGEMPTEEELAATSVMNGSKPCPDRCLLPEGTACEK